MKNLFSPFTIKNISLRNRTVMPALASFLIEDDGSITDKTVEHYRMRASGGVAMVITEACSVAPEGIVSPHQARIYDDRFIEGLSKVANIIKSEGAIAGVQIHHGGRQTSARVINRKPFAPSNLPCPTIRGEVEPLSIDGIQEIVAKFGEAASRALEAGFDLIEIHGAHGYLINQFLSGFSNIREDEYGGDTKKRTRFAVEVIREVRKRVGDEFPISFKISAQEFVPGGLTVEESIKIVKTLAEEGIDLVQVSAGNDATPEWICQPMFMEQACLADSAGAIKKEIGIPVMAVGRINDPLLADRIIGEGKADLVCFGRGLLADPEMPRKASEGRLDDIRKCIACNTCMESIFRKGRVECLVNPTLGHEKEMVLTPADSPKKVMVVGGGPGGMQVAWVAAKRGHKVYLYEKTAELGGQLILGSAANYKKELLSLINFQKKQIEKSDVSVFLSTEVTMDMVQKEKPDVVILATGSKPFVPPIEGIDGPIVQSLSQVFIGDKPEVLNTILIGGGATGCEVALHLSDSGSPVTIVEKLPKIGIQIESITKKIILTKLKKNNVKIHTECELSKIKDNGAIVTNKEGKEFFLEGERIIVSIGNTLDNSLYDEIKDLDIPTYQIGDCLEPRSAKAAIYDGAIIGRTI
jgi:2,4-dienoyl-CoA reductase-like NADH-dependent reductase (Old Yellow Enzyme family)/thioredoxin reductase